MGQACALFAFGTLMDTEVLQLVSGQPLDHLRLEPATVADHARRWVADDHYPVLIACPGTCTQGLIIRDLGQEAMNRIIFFEGDEFTLREIQVERSDGQEEQVCYFADNRRKLVSDQEWQLAHWQRTTKPDTLPRVVRYMRCYGMMSIAEADAHW